MRTVVVKEERSPRWRLYDEGLNDQQIAEHPDIGVGSDAIQKWRKRNGLPANDPAGQSLEKRFVSRVDKYEGCWLWTGRTDDQGYGIGIKHGEANEYAHRASWVLHNGKVPPDKMVLHECHNPTCVNPEHLYLGDHQDNMRDKREVGRMKGEHHPGAVLSEEAVQRLRLLSVAGVDEVLIAAEMGVTPATVRDARLRRSWRHVEVEVA